MAGLEAKLGSLMSSVGHLTDAVDGLKRSTQGDHDTLTRLESGQVEWKKTLFTKVDEAAAAALAAKEHAEELVNKLREELAKRGDVKGDRTFHVIMVVVGVVVSIIGSWVAMKVGMAGGANAGNGH